MTERSDELPSGAGDLAREYLAIWKAYSGLGEACAVAGPIEGKALRLVKLDEGISKEEIKHVAVLAIPTLGLPQGVRVLTWIEDITDEGRQSSPRRVTGN